jgi:hypothetical protein
MSRGFAVVLLVFAALLSTHVAHAQASVETSVSAEQVEVGQELRIRLQGQSPEHSLENPRLRVPPSFSVNGPSIGTQQQITIVNGQMQRTIGTTATWVLVPTKTGTFRIGPGSFDDQGKPVTGSVVEIQVVAEGTLPKQRRRSRFPFDDDPFSPFGRRGGSLFDELFPTEPRSLAPPAPDEYQVGTAPDQTAFLRATIEPATAVVGEQVTLRVYAYGSQGPFAEGPAKESRHPDFFAIPISSSSVKEKHYAVEVGGQTFLGLKVREIALFPLKAGELSIGPMTMSFYGQRYSSRRNEGIERSTDPIVLKVTEPPTAGRPAGYQLGDVGDFTLEAKVAPLQVEAGGAVSVVATLKGSGRLPASLSTPEQKGLEWLEPTLGDEMKVSPEDVIGGSRTFTYLVRMSKAGKVDLGELTLPYYSPSQRTYQVARAKLGTIDVAKGEQKPDAPEKKEKLGEQFALRQELAGDGPRRQWFDQAWYFPSLFVPPALVLLLRASQSAWQAARRRRNEKRSDPGSLASEALNLAARELARGATAQGLAAIERALFSALEAATQVKGRAVLLGDLERVLSREGLDPKDAQTAKALLEECQTLRFGNGAGAASELLGRSRDFVKRLARPRKQRAKA